MVVVTSIGLRRDHSSKLRERRFRIQERKSAALLRHNRDARDPRRVEGGRKSQGGARSGRSGDAGGTNYCPFRRRRRGSAAIAGRGEGRPATGKARTAATRVAARRKGAGQRRD